MHPMFTMKNNSSSQLNFLSRQTAAWISNFSLKGTDFVLLALPEDQHLVELLKKQEVWDAEFIDDNMILYRRISKASEFREN